MTKTTRIVLVDALRGFALLGIVLIHFVEHFDFFYLPETNFFFSAETNQKVTDIIMFLISGKAYSIFALTFGFSFFIQINSKEKQGIDFRGRFAWRLTILFVMGLIHSLIYRGDILHIYAILGIPLIFLYKANNKILLGTSFLLLIEIPLLYPLAMSFADPSYTFTPDWGGNWFAEGEEVYAHGSLWEVIKMNWWKSRYLVYAWTYYTGRAVQLLALFIIGLYMGRKGYFENPSKYKQHIIWTLAISVIAIAIFHFSKLTITNLSFTELQKGLLGTLIQSYANLAYTAVIICTFMLVYHIAAHTKAFNSLAIYGKMSLTNYVFQAIFGVIFFFGFGFGMWRIMGATWSLIFGFCFFMIQIMASKYWMSRYYYGPMEWLWRALTYMNFKLKYKRTNG